MCNARKAESDTRNLIMRRLVDVALHAHFDTSPPYSIIPKAVWGCIKWIDMACYKQTAPVTELAMGLGISESASMSATGERKENKKDKCLDNAGHAFHLSQISIIRRANCLSLHAAKCKHRESKAMPLPYTPQNTWLKPPMKSPISGHESYAFKFCLSFVLAHCTFLLAPLLIRATFTAGP